MSCSWCKVFTAQKTAIGSWVWTTLGWTCWHNSEMDFSSTRFLISVFPILSIFIYTFSFSLLKRICRGSQILHLGLSDQCNFFKHAKQTNILSTPTRINLLNTYKTFYRLLSFHVSTDWKLGRIQCLKTFRPLVESNKREDVLVGIVGMYYIVNEK